MILQVLTVQRRSIKGKQNNIIWSTSNYLVTIGTRARHEQAKPCGQVGGDDGNCGGDDGGRGDNGGGDDLVDDSDYGDQG